MKDECEKWIEYVDSRSWLPTWGEVKERYRKSRPLASAVEVEPLAVLAVRKGWPRIHITEFRGLWYISLWEYMATNPATKEPFSGKSHAECEAKARAYLNGLPDAGKGGE